MQSEKQWDPEAVLLFGAGLMVSFCLGILGIVSLTKFGGLSDNQAKFYGFIINSACVHGVGLILAHFFLRLHRLTWPEFLGLKDPNLRMTVLLAIGVAVLAFPTTVGLNEVSRQFIVWIHGTAKPQPAMDVLANSVALWQRIWFGVNAIIVVPVAEEIIFRAILYRTIRQFTTRGSALLVSAIIFGIVHGSWMTLVPLTVFAIILTLLYDKTDNLMAPVVVHSLFNAANFFLYLNQEDVTRGFHQVFR